MNLEELRKSMESEATVENKKLKSEIKRLKEELRTVRHEAQYDKSLFLDDCRALANRCFALTCGTTCMFCELSAYRCPHAMSFVEKAAAVNKLVEECEDDV